MKLGTVVSRILLTAALVGGISASFTATSNARESRSDQSLAYDGLTGETRNSPHVYDVPGGMSAAILADTNERNNLMIADDNVYAWRSWYAPDAVLTLPGNNIVVSRDQVLDMFNAYTVTAVVNFQPNPIKMLASSPAAMNPDQVYYNGNVTYAATEKSTGAHVQIVERFAAAGKVDNRNRFTAYSESVDLAIVLS